jgi:hypothetical protein
MSTIIDEEEAQFLLKCASRGIDRLLDNWDEILPRNRKRLAGGIAGDANAAYRMLVELNARILKEQQQQQHGHLSG